MLDLCVSKVTHPERGVPASSAKGFAVGGYAQAADAVGVTGYGTQVLATNSVPHVQVGVIRAGKDKASGVREGGGEDLLHRGR